MEAFQGSLDDLEGLGARVAGISADTFASQGAFAERNGITFPLLSDWPAFQTISTFGVGMEGSNVAQRTTFVFDADGVLRTVIDAPGDPTAHATGALAAVTEIVG